MDTALICTVLGGLLLTSTAEATNDRVLLADSSLSDDLRGLVSFELAGWNWRSIDELVGDVALVSLGSDDSACEPLFGSEFVDSVTAASESIQLMEFDRSSEIVERTFSNLGCLEAPVVSASLRDLYLGASRLEEITGTPLSFDAGTLLETFDGAVEVELFYGGQWSRVGSEVLERRPQVWVDGNLEPRSVSRGVHLVQLVNSIDNEVYSNQYVNLSGDSHLLWAEPEDAHHSLRFRVAQGISSLNASPILQALEIINEAEIYRVSEVSDAALVKRTDGSIVVSIVSAPDRNVIAFGLGVGASGGLVGDPMAAGAAWVRYSPYLGFSFVSAVEIGLSAELLPPEHPDFWALTRQRIVLGGLRYGAPLGISGWECGGDIASRTSGDENEIGFRLSSGAYRSAWENTGIRTLLSGTKWPENWDVSINIGIEWSR